MLKVPSAGYCFTLLENWLFNSHLACGLMIVQCNTASSSRVPTYKNERVVVDD